MIDSLNIAQDGSLINSNHISLIVSVVALLVSWLVVRSNTRAQVKANQIKEQENMLKYIYDRRVQLRNKLIWLTRFPHNNIEWCLLQIDENNHPYALSDFQWGFVSKCPGDKFCYTVINELDWLHSEMMILFPTVAEKYKNYCNLLKSAHECWMRLKEPELPQKGPEYSDEMSKAMDLWAEIIHIDMPQIMMNDIASISR